MAALDGTRAALSAVGGSPESLARQGFPVNRDGRRRSGLELLALPDCTAARMAAAWPELADIPAGIWEQLQIEALYAGYVERQAADIRAFRRDETLGLPPDLDYRSVGSLSNEIREKLNRARPATIGAAARIPGVTPAAVNALLRFVRRDGARRTA